MQTKRWLSVLLCMLLCIFMLPATASAAENYGFKVYDDEQKVAVEVTSDNAENVLGDGTVYYDALTNTLTLNNANLTSPAASGGSYVDPAINVSGQHLTIQLIGKNTIEGGRCIYASNSLTISGNGSLVANGTTFTVRANAGDLTIDGATVYASGSDISAHGSMTIQNGADVTGISPNGRGIYATSGITIIGSTVKAESTSSNYYQGMHTQGDISITDSTVTGTSICESGLSAAENINIINSTVEATTNNADSGAAAINGNKVTISGGNVTATATGKYSNAIYSSGSTIEILNGATVTAKAPSESSYPAVFGAEGVSVSNSNLTAEAGGDVALYSPTNIDIQNSIINASAPNGWNGILAGITLSASDSWISTSGNEDFGNNITDSALINGNSGKIIGSHTIPGDVTVPTDTTVEFTEGSGLIVPKDATFTNNGIITGDINVTNNGIIICNNHIGSTATCVDKAVCTICGSQYGELNPDNHSPASEWTQENGKHYHICQNGCGAHLDEANCDGGTATCISKAKCSVCGREYGDYGAHNLTPHNAKEPTCTETGNSQYWECSVCSRLFADAQGNTGTTIADVTIAATGHNWGNPAWKWADDGSSATATFTCANDNAHTEQVSASITSEVKAAATCTESGATTYKASVNFNGTEYSDTKEVTDIAPTGHSWGDWSSNGNGTHTHTCSRCQATETESCTGGTATCTALAVCEICGQTYGVVNPDNHTGEAVWTQTATTHSRAYDCCGAVVIAEEAHEWNDGVCSECGYECQHSGGEATCANKAVCDICGEEYGGVNASNHTNLVKTDAKQATHLTEGNTEYWYCDGCNKYFSDEDGTKEIALADTVLPKLTGHTPDETGWHSDETNHWQTCECGVKLKEAAHDFVWETDKEATATEAGSKHEECTVCGYKKDAVEIPATGTPEEPTDPSKPGDTPSGSNQTGDKDNPDTGKTDSPQTGDSSNIVLWIALALISGVALAGTCIFGRRKKYSR